MFSKNIIFKSEQIKNYYSCNRDSWNQLYPSEQWVFNRIAIEMKGFGDILDIGCACGGLCKALKEKFSIASYTGVDINSDAILWALNNKPIGIPTTFLAGDILQINLVNQYNTVISLSCADWNIETESIIRTCWKLVKDNGYFIVSLRLTDKKSVNNIHKSYQYIDFSIKPTCRRVGINGNETIEKANYVVFNFKDALKLFHGLTPTPTLIGSYGYWGTPSATAVTPFDRLVFAVFYLKKDIYAKGTKVEFHLPSELFI